MKKIITAVFSLAVILALVVSASAASLSANWTEIWNMVQDTGCGEVTVDSKGTLSFDNEDGGFSSSIAAVYNNKVKVDGLEMHLYVENLYFDSVIYLPQILGELITVSLSADKPTDFVPYNVNDLSKPVDATWKNPFSGFSHGLDTKVLSTAAVTFTLYGDWESYCLFGGMCSAIKDVGFGNPAVLSLKSGDDFLLKFVVDGENVKILVNGEDTGVTFLAADVLDSDGLAYLAFMSNSCGVAHSIFEVKYINGMAANEWDGSEGSCAPIGSETASSEPAPSEPAPSEVVPSSTASVPAGNGGCGNNA